MAKIKPKSKPGTAQQMPDNEKVKNRSLELQVEIERERNERVIACTKEVNDVLKKHNCTLIAQVLFTEGQAPVYRCNVVSKQYP